jgi:Leucine-rich repeat (LRR) protein
MRTVDKLTDQDGVSQIQTVHHSTKATTVLSKILSNDHTQANLSEQLKETEPTSSYNTNTSPEVQKALQDRYDSIGAPKWNVVHGGTHRGFSNIPSTERQALQDLYESTDGAHWNYGSSSGGTQWSFDDPDVNPCEERWYGVQCVDNHVTGLTLAGSNLTGTIPESLSQLTMLMHLDLRGNLLIGRVPTTLCQIKSLVRVDLEGNGIVCYYHCLEHATVEVKVHPSTPVCNIIPSPSSLSGPSKDVSSSSSLVMTSSYSNNISPEERQALQDVYDSTDGPNWYNYGGVSWDFSKPDANPCEEGWSGVTCSIDYHIKYLSLGYRNLRGTIPSTIGQLSFLYDLSLSNNQLIGSIPSTIGNLSSLNYLNLKDNRLIGTIPSTIDQIPYLYGLYVSYNRLTGIVPSSLCQMNYLGQLEFGGNLLQCYPYCLRSSTLYSLSVGSTPICEQGVPSNISPEERQALQDLYDSTDGPNWYNYGGTWDFSNPDANPCDEGWDGVYCSSDLHITSLSLSHRNLRGTIPSTIGQLSSLQYLYMYGNPQLIGSIPSTIGQLSFLYDLSLSNNQLIGSIPSTIGQLSSLNYLNLKDNLLIGTIPSTIDQLSYLYSLYLSNNRLTGIVPYSLCQMNNLAELVFGGNLLQCYPYCLQSSSVQTLRVGSTPTCEQGVPSNISPEERQALQDLYDSTDGPNWSNYDWYYYDTAWDFSNPDANPCDEQWFGVTCSLDYRVISLSLSYNNLRGTIPSTIGQLSSLEDLDLSDNYLIGSIPSTIGQLSSLYSLYLSYNELNGTIPSTIGQLSSLYSLYLSDNLLFGTIPSTIGQLSSLEWLDLSNNRLTGIVPSSLCQMYNLGELAFGGNLLQCYPFCLRSSSVHYLTVGLTPLCDPPDGVSLNISPLERQALQDLYDSTDGPNWYNNDNWDFSNPDANPCDEEWYGIGCSGDYNVTYLFLEYRNLRGTIPESISQLSYLRELCLSRNQLIRSIPSTIGQLSSLQYLDLSSNRLTGSIPSTIDQIPYLYSLYLSNNRLTGIVPSSLCEMNDLGELVFGGNLLQCYPLCLRYSILYYLHVGSTPICDQPDGVSTSSPSTTAPSVVSTSSPTTAPTVVLTRSPSIAAPSIVPSSSPSTAAPTVVSSSSSSTAAPTVVLTHSLSTVNPTASPSRKKSSPTPTSSPSRKKSSPAPTASPSRKKSSPAPTASPIRKKSSPAPTASPNRKKPSPAPTSSPSRKKSSPAPTASPSRKKSSPAPTVSPSRKKSSPAPTSSPSRKKPSPTPVSIIKFLQHLLHQ